VCQINLGLFNPRNTAGEFAVTCHIFFTCSTRLCTRQRVWNVCLIGSDCHILSNGVYNRNLQQKIKSWIHAVALKATNRSFSVDFRLILQELWAQFSGAFRFGYFCTVLRLSLHIFERTPPRQHKKWPNRMEFFPPAVGVPWYCKLVKSIAFYCVYLGRTQD